ncbi:MAG: FHA domain-containing protein [Thermoanaerobaculaceae bacterium]|nr:FHA domain-containing protein [Thermoanaerobaculaceae bacterium]NLH12304.1 FHA domain-containing protein [Holophagae bacterium]HPW55349.1 FHA domain-containing protein [Thermoanaerobaculaceae bacterium]
MRRRRLLGLALVVAAVLAVRGAVAEESIPLVVALDSSRSLKPGELAAAASLVRPVLASLPAGTPVGVMEFNDAPRWVVPLPGSAAAASEVLGRIVPAGTSTVLLDALVTAARELPAGGVILVITDGRDEGSAATMSDLTALLAARQVRILAAGTGHTVDSRSLRRLAVLSGGQYLGLVGATSAGTLEGAVGQARTAVERSLPPTPAPPPTPVPESTSTLTPPVRQTAGPDWLALGLGVVAVAALGLGMLAWRRRAAATGNLCPDCGRPMASWETECATCKLDRLDLRRAEQQAIAAPPAKPIADEELTLDPSVFDKAPLEDRLEKTLALTEQIILVVRSPRGPQRSYAINPEHVVAVGRAAKVNSITLDDPSASAQHFKIVPKGEDFYVVDLESSNGTFVNGERVRVHRLHNGDTIMAGQVECQFRTQLVRTA